jgi:hypothetical protein
MSDARLSAILREMVSLVMIGLRRTYPKTRPLGEHLIEGMLLTAAM